MFMEFPHVTQGFSSHFFSTQNNFYSSIYHYLITLCQVEEHHKGPLHYNTVFIFCTYASPNSAHTIAPFRCLLCCHSVMKRVDWWRCGVFEREASQPALQHK